MGVPGDLIINVVAAPPYHQPLLINANIIARKDIPKVFCIALLSLLVGTCTGYLSFRFIERKDVELSVFLVLVTILFSLMFVSSCLMIIIPNRVCTCLK